MSDAIPFPIADTGFELLPDETFLKKLDIENDSDEYYPVWGSFIQKNKVCFLIGLSVEDGSETSTIPVVVSDDQVIDMRKAGR